MTIYLNSNATSVGAQSALNKVTNNLNKSLQKLATGYKINNASDGAGSLLASENLRTLIRGSDVAMSNVQQGLSMLQAADGAMQQVYEHLQAMRDITVAAANESTSTTEYAAYAADYQAHASAITLIATAVSYNTKNLIGAGHETTMAIQTGAEATDTLDIGGAFSDNTDVGLGVNTYTLASAGDATTRMGEVDAALGTLANQMAVLGGFESQLEGRMNILSTLKENFTSAEASIRNTDVAAETAKVTQLQIVQQAAAYALAQANQAPSIAMRLLQ